jgi:Helix-turn-helix domain
MSRQPLLTTKDAAALIGRSPAAVRCALKRGQLQGEPRRDGWRLRRDDVLAWAATHPSTNRPPRRLHHEEAAALLNEYGSIVADELALLMQVHVGNARKYLAILAVQGRAHRTSGGEWLPGPADATQAVA